MDKIKLQFSQLLEFCRDALSDQDQEILCKVIRCDLDDDVDYSIWVDLKHDKFEKTTAVLTTQRGPIRNFRSLDSAVKVVRDLGFQTFQVLM